MAVAATVVAATVVAATVVEARAAAARVDRSVSEDSCGARGDYGQLVPLREAWVDAQHGDIAQGRCEEQRRKVVSKALDRLPPRLLERAALHLTCQRRPE